MQALAADDRQALRRSVSELRRFIPTIAPLLPLQAVPEFVLVRAIDLKAPPTAAHKPANSAASWHPAYWTILGALVVAMVGALWVLLSGSTTDSSSVDVGQAPPSGVAASALPPEPGHPAAIHRLASHPKKVTKKKGVLKPANDAASSPGGEAATEPAPLQSFYEVAPSTSEETTSSESPAQ
jgi:hypothetical protein